MAVNDQNSDEIREFSFVLKRGDTSNYDQVFAITGDQTTLCNPIYGVNNATGCNKL